jgi:hypothetical protein
MFKCLESHGRTPSFSLLEPFVENVFFSGRLPHGQSHAEKIQQRQSEAISAIRLACDPEAPWEIQQGHLWRIILVFEDFEVSKLFQMFDNFWGKSANPLNKNVFSLFRA